MMSSYVQSSQVYGQVMCMVPCGGGNYSIETNFESKAVAFVI